MAGLLAGKADSGRFGCHPPRRSRLCLSLSGHIAEQIVFSFFAQPFINSRQRLVLIGENVLLAVFKRVAAVSLMAA
jgi:hypothetical protein